MAFTIEIRIFIPTYKNKKKKQKKSNRMKKGKTQKPGLFCTLLEVIKLEKKKKNYFMLDLPKL